MPGKLFKAAAVILLSGALPCLPQSAHTWKTAAAHAAEFSPEARIVVLDIPTGRLLAASHLDEAARTLAAPGSTLKPLALYGLVAAGRWDPKRRVACSRKLAVGGRALDCSHPLVGPLDARQALTWSCNTYFATVAGTLGLGDLRALLAPTGLLGTTGLATEAFALFRDPQNADSNRLTLLGVDGIRVTPLELASSYRWLAMQLAAPHPEGSHAALAAEVVKAGMTDSAGFGMAGAASLGGVPVAGKTGTASSTGVGQSHGWFVGLAPAEQPSVVVAVYLPAGHGADAARVAAELLAGSPLKLEPR